MANRRPEKQTKRTRAIGKRVPLLPEAMVVEQKAQAGLAEASKKLREALTTLEKARAGSAKERKAHKAARALMKALLAAKRKLRKAQKKRRKTAAKQAEPQPQAKAARKQPKLARRVGRRASAIRRSRARPRMQSRVTTVKDTDTKSGGIEIVGGLDTAIPTEATEAGHPQMAPVDLIHAKRSTRSELSD